MKENIRTLLETLKSQLHPSQILTAADDTLHYGQDWSEVKGEKPSVVVFPQTTDDVVKVIKSCSQNKISIVPSGGRTGLAGGAVVSKDELVLSLERMNKIGPLDPIALTLEVEAGAITQAVHEYCEPYDLTWPLDFASKGSSHIGGNIATNAGGLQVIHYGGVRNWILGLTVVTPQGKVLELNGALEKNNTGFDLRQLYIGTEGTLGVITKAILKLCPIIKSKECLFFGVANANKALQLLQESRTQFSLLAFEFFSHNCLKAVQDQIGVRSPLQQNSPAYVLMEIKKENSAKTSSLESWLEKILNLELVEDGAVATSNKDQQHFWSLRENITESLKKLGPIHKNDVAVPVGALEKFIPELFQIANRSDQNHELFLFGHLGDGNMHINTLKPKAATEKTFKNACYAFDQTLFELVHKYKGSISAEHGIGLLKKDFLAFSRSPEELELLVTIKRTLDPNQILNPGKILELD